MINKQTRRGEGSGGVLLGNVTGTGVVKPVIVGFAFELVFTVAVIHRRQNLRPRQKRFLQSREYVSL